MRSLVLLLVLCVTPLLAQAPPGAADQLIEVLYVPHQDDDTELVYAIPEAALDRAPAWSPEEEKPPLTIARAVAVARAHLGASRAAGEGEVEYILSSIHLEAVHGRDRAAWYYMIGFHESTTWPRWPRTTTVLVMLDGTVLPPKARPKSELSPRSEVP